MRPAARIISPLLCAALLTAAPGPRVWAAVVAVRVAAGHAAAPLSPATHLLDGTNAFGADLRAPSSAPSLTRSLLPGLAGLRTSSTGRAADRPAARLAIPAGALPAAAQAPRPGAGPRQAARAVRSRGFGGLRARVRTAGSEAAPFLKAISSARGTPGGLHAAGVGLEEVLTGRRTAARSATPPVAAARSSRSDSPRLPHVELDAAKPGPKPVPAPGVSPEQRKAFRFYAAGVSLTKVGVEALNLVVPILLLSQYGAATYVGMIFIAADLAGMLAGWASGPLIDRFKPSRVLAITAGLQMAVVGVVPLALAAGLPVGLPLFLGLFAVNGGLSGVFDTARRAAMPRILGRDEGVLREHNAKLYILREILSIAAVGGAGLLLQRLGALTALAMHPASYALVFYFLARLALRRPPRGGTDRTAPVRKGKAKPNVVDIFHGARVVWRDPTLRIGALVNIPIIAPTSSSTRYSRSSTPRRSWRVRPSRPCSSWHGTQGSWPPPFSLGRTPSGAARSAGSNTPLS
ncbi:MAG: hypothetical protein ABII00_17595 [Elusimicrobiota bacterium]